MERDSMGTSEIARWEWVARARGGVKRCEREGCASEAKEWECSDDDLMVNGVVIQENCVRKG